MTVDGEVVTRLGGAGATDTQVTGSDYEETPCYHDTLHIHPLTLDREGHLLAQLRPGLIIGHSTLDIEASDVMVSGHRHLSHSL